MFDHSNTSNDDAFNNINFGLFNDVHVISTFDNFFDINKTSNDVNNSNNYFNDAYHNNNDINNYND